MAVKYDFNFITDGLAKEAASAAIEAIVETYGDNFSPLYLSNLQPVSPSNLNSEALLQFDLPSGVTIKPYADMASGSIAYAINSLLQGLAPIISAYGFLMPIIQVIIGIIEVLCALLNPFAVKRALKRLIRQYLPKLFALFPTLAIVVIILGIIKTILAIVLFIMTVIVPLLQLMKRNAQLVIDAIKTKEPDKEAAAKEKIQDLIIWLGNQLGIIKTLMPLLDLILALFKIALKRPCKKRKNANDGGDCCSDDVCPDVLLKPPSGRGLLVPLSLSPDLVKNNTSFFLFKLSTNNSRVTQIKKYNDNKDQINLASNTNITACCPAGSEGEDCPTFTVKITSKRGTVATTTASIIDINGTDITIISPSLIRFVGSVNYEVVPNFDMLVARQVIAIGCDPEISAAQADLDAAFPRLEEPVDIGDFRIQVGNLDTSFDFNLNRLRANPYDPNNIQSVQDDLTKILDDFSNLATNKMREISSSAVNINTSALDVDKSVVRSDNTDFAVVTVIPKDDAGNSILKNLPENALPNVEIYTTFGILSNKRFNRALGGFQMDLRSPLTGSADITAKIGSLFISDLTNGVNTTRNVNVRFVADSVLPARRRTVAVPEKEPRRG